jgi:hypothetical protein
MTQPSLLNTEIYLLCSELLHVEYIARPQHDSESIEPTGSNLLIGGL